jgi:hypothetical protein
MKLQAAASALPRGPAVPSEGGKRFKRAREESMTGAWTPDSTAT